jgi:hypothetical protein
MITTKFTLTIAALGATGMLLAGCGGSAAKTASTASVPAAATVDPTQPTPQVAASWATKWCQAQPGMTKAQLYAVMGQPTDDSFADQASWSAYEWQFNAFYGTDGRVRQLDINTVELSAAEKAALGCSDTRTLA